MLKQLRRGRGASRLGWERRKSHEKNDKTASVLLPTPFFPFPSPCTVLAEFAGVGT